MSHKIQTILERQKIYKFAHQHQNPHTISHNGAILANLFLKFLILTVEIHSFHFGYIRHVIIDPEITPLKEQHVRALSFDYLRWNFFATAVIVTVPFTVRVTRKRCVMATIHETTVT